MRSPACAGNADGGEPEREIRPVDEIPGERPDREVRAGQRTTDGRLLMNEYGRMRWQCRRGLKELDVLLERYLQEHFSTAPAAEQQAFAELLCLPDPLLLSYIMGRDQPDNQEQRRVIASLRRTPRT